MCQQADIEELRHKKWLREWYWVSAQSYLSKINYYESRNLLTKIIQWFNVSFYNEHQYNISAMVSCTKETKRLDQQIKMLALKISERHEHQ